MQNALINEILAQNFVYLNYKENLGDNILLNVHH